MAKAYDVPADELISKLAEQEKDKKIASPKAGLAFVKTGPHTEKIPQNKDWWYTRCASLLRKVYIHGPIGVSDLKSRYGGRKQIGYNLAHHRNAGGAIIRKVLEELEGAGVRSRKNRGRLISEEGTKRIDRIVLTYIKRL